MASELEIPTSRRPAIRKLIALPKENSEALLEALTKANFSASAKEMSTSIKDAVPSIPEADLADIVDAVYELYFVREVSGAGPAKFLNDLSQAVQETILEGPSANDASIAQETKTRLRAFLGIESIKTVSKGITLQREEERLYCEARILSDIRPVFASDPKKPPVGAVISHTLKLSYHEGKEHKEFFVVLDKSDLDALKNVIDRAHNKASSLSALLETYHLPDLGM